MSEWIDLNDRSPEKHEEIGMDSESPFFISKTVMVKSDPDDRWFLRLYKSGEAKAYFDFGEECWYWHELSGGPMYAPTHWKHLPVDTE